ncbi:hypothetical protein EDB84DRAFT_412458 [Lactarius hengduanensis]|nr:hypothetical protein EDB84DRAFT_412458 [Lactarius hengduanensis]
MPMYRITYTAFVFPITARSLPSTGAGTIIFPLHPGSPPTAATLLYSNEVQRRDDSQDPREEKVKHVEIVPVRPIQMLSISYT